MEHWSELIAGIGSVVLTGFLVILYKRQQRQLAAQHEAILEVTDVEWYGDKGIFWISNYGNGVAKNLSLSTLVKSNAGDHRTHSVRSNALKRIGKEGEWTNLIEPGEERVPFYGTSKVGQVPPPNWHNKWASCKFSKFVQKAKENNATEVKFCHVVEGAALSGVGCWDRVDPVNQSFDPQDFDYKNSLGNLPSFRKDTSDNTFYPYFRNSITRKWIFKVYEKSVDFMNWLLPWISLGPRAWDASGTKRVKRVLLRQQLRTKTESLRGSIRSLVDRDS
jgi:hypothetical protein